MSTDCNSLLGLSGSGRKDAIFSVFPEGDHPHLSPKVFIFEALSRDLPAEAFTWPHVVITRQYLSSSFTWEEIHGCFSLWTALGRLINEFPITHRSVLSLCQMPLTSLLLFISAVVGSGVWVVSSSAALREDGAVSVPHMWLTCSQRRHRGYLPLEKLT